MQKDIRWILGALNMCIQTVAVLCVASHNGFIIYFPKN